MPIAVSTCVVSPWPSDRSAPSAANAPGEAPGPHAPILVMSASDPERLADQIDAAGHCPKPFDLDLLIRLVREHVMRR